MAGSGSGSGIPPRKPVFYRPNWRIEINRRKAATNGYNYHWIWRLTLEDSKRISSYGGSLETLPDPTRWKQYKRNSKRHEQRITANV